MIYFRSSNASSYLPKKAILCVNFCISIMYHASSLRIQFSAGSNLCTHPWIFYFFLCFISCHEILLFMVLFCFYVSFTLFLKGYYQHRKQKKVGRRAVASPVHILNFVHMFTYPSFKSKTHNIKCFWTFSTCRQFMFSGRNISVSWCGAYIQNIVFVGSSVATMIHTYSFEF